MVRTRADASTVRVSGAKAPRKVLALNPGPSKKSNPLGGVGGNPYCPRDTPDWQKSITCFFGKASEKNIDSQNSSSSNGGSAAHAEDSGTEIAEDNGTEVGEDNGIEVAEDNTVEVTEDNTVEVTEDNTVEVTEDNAVEVTEDNGSEISKNQFGQTNQSTQADK